MTMGTGWRVLRDARSRAARQPTVTPGLDPAQTGGSYAKPVRHVLDARVEPAHDAERAKPSP